MKLKNIVDFDKLFEIVDNCEGQVHMITNEGDDFVLTSKISRYVLGVIKDKHLELLTDLELVCDNPKDTMKFIDFMIH